MCMVWEKKMSENALVVASCTCLSSLACQHAFPHIYEYYYVNCAAQGGKEGEEGERTPAANIPSACHRSFISTAFCLADCLVGFGGEAACSILTVPFSTCALPSTPSTTYYRCLF